MTREIKFKIWDKHCKYFINGLDLLKGEYDDDRNTVTYQLDKVMGDRNSEERFIYCQFTGLKDKNGVEIYEGDILRNEADKNPNQQIVFINGMFCLEDEDSPLYRYRPELFWEVIGNIYESKHLLDK